MIRSWTSAAVRKKTPKIDVMIQCGMIFRTIIHFKIDLPRIDCNSVFPPSFSPLFRLIEMRMPKTSSFSVRDILDMPKMKDSSHSSDESDSDTSKTKIPDSSSPQRRPPQGKSSLKKNNVVKCNFGGYILGTLPGLNVHDT